MAITRKNSGASTSPFSVGMFRQLWVANLISAFGASIQGVGAAWLMTELTNSTTMVALVQTSTVLPIMLFALMAGAIADNFERRSLMLVAQSFMLSASIGLVVMAWLGWLTPFLLLTMTFAIGCGIAFNSPASQAALGEIVPREALPAAVAYSSMTFNIARSLGPALGGAIVSATSAGSAFIVNAFSYLPLTTVLLRWRVPPPDRRLPREGIGQAMAAGLSYAMMSPHILRVIPRATLFGAAIAGVSALLPIIARNQLGGGPAIFGLLLGAYGAGSVAAGFLVSPLLARFGSERIISFASLMTAAGTATVAISPFVPLSMAALLLVGIGWVLALSSCNTVIQLATPRWVVARAVSLYQMAAFGAMAVGALICGLAAARFGTSATLLGAATLHPLSILAGRFFPVIDEARDLAPPEWREPSLVLPIEGRSGPIVISIVYDIALDDTRAFLELMAERRRVRRRDGAHGWTLMRDLGHPERWIERYDVATWHDYVRHNTRPTMADAENWQIITNLHKGAEPPQVSRLIKRQAGSMFRNRAQTDFPDYFRP